MISGILALAAGGGKTTSLLRWLAEGERIPVFPGWSRVVACANSAARNSLLRLADSARTADNEPTDTGPALAPEVLEHCVVLAAELPRLLAQARGAVQYAVDDVDQALQAVLGLGQPPAVATVTIPGDIADELGGEPALICRHCLCDTRHTPPARDGARCPRCRSAYSGPARKAEYTALREAGLITAPTPRKEPT